MFTIDFFAQVDATPVESRAVDCALLEEAVEQAEAMLANRTAGLADRPDVVGYVITDGLNAIVYNTFEKNLTPGKDLPASKMTP